MKLIFIVIKQIKLCRQKKKSWCKNKWKIKNWYWIDCAKAWKSHKKSSRNCLCSSSQILTLIETFMADFYILSYQINSTFDCINLKQSLCFLYTLQHTYCIQITCRFIVLLLVKKSYKLNFWTLVTQHHAFFRIKRFQQQLNRLHIFL